MQSQREGGMVSLITAIIVAILLLVLTISLVTLMNGEQRQASDSDQSVKAYYAAMSGVEDAIQQIKNDLNNPPYKVKPSTLRKPPCSPGNGVGPYLDPPLNATRWTCQGIEAKINTATTTIPKDNDAQFRFPSSPPPSSVGQMRISWNSNSSSTEGSVLPGYVGPGGQFPTNTVVPPWTFPAVLEITVVGYPNGLVIPGPSVFSKTLVVTPDPAPAGAVMHNINLPANPVNGACSSAPYFGDYNCYVDLTGFVGGPGYNYVVVIHPRYKDASVQVEAYNSCGFAPTGYSNCGSIPQYEGFATIDVTGQSGNAYRRIIEHINLTANSAAGLDFAVFSDTNICKDYGVSVGSAITGSCLPDDTKL